MEQAFRKYEVFSPTFRKGKLFFPVPPPLPPPGLPLVINPSLLALYKVQHASFKPQIEPAVCPSWEHNLCPTELSFDLRETSLHAPDT